MSLHSLLRSLCIFVLFTLSICANTANYEAAKRHAGQDLKLGQAYGFRKGTLLNGASLGHVRLVVAWINGTQRNLDVGTAMFQQVQETGTNGGLKRYFGAKCQSIHENTPPAWPMTAGSDYKFLGPVRFTDFEGGRADIQDVHAQLIEKNNVYNLIMNNCDTHVQNLFNKIKGRDLLLMARDLLRGGYTLAKRNNFLDTTKMGEGRFYASSAPSSTDAMAVIRNRDTRYGRMRQRDAEDWMYDEEWTRDL